MARMKEKADPKYDGEGRYIQPVDRKNGPWDDYDLDSFLRTLQDAKKITKNRKLMAKVRQHAQKKLAAARAMADNVK